MAVFSNIDKEKQKYIENQYNIKVEKFEFIEMGILNSNFLLTTKEKEKYILRIYEAERSLEEEKQELNLLKIISDEIPVPKIKLNIKKENIIEFNSKKMALFEYIEGDTLKIEKIKQNTLREIAWYLGKLHSKTKNIDKKIYTRISRINFEYYFEKIKKSEINFEEKNKILLLAEEIKKIDFSSLPSGIIHSDIFPDNVIIKDDSINGILDFNESYYGPFIYDIAIVINFWIRDKKYLSFEKENDLIRDFLNNYSRHRKIEREEVKLLSSALKKTALIFIMLRIYKEKIKKSYETAIEINSKSYKSLLNLLD